MVVLLDGGLTVALVACGLQCCFGLAASHPGGPILEAPPAVSSVSVSPYGGFTWLT